MNNTEEELRALMWARDLLNDLAYSWHWDWKAEGILPDAIRSQHKRVPKSVRLHARSVLRHYPGKSAILAYWRKDSSLPSPRRKDSKPACYRRSKRAKTTPIR